MAEPRSYSDQRPSPEALLEAARREERRAVAERVRREHSFLHRARRLLDVALEVRAEQDARR